MARSFVFAALLTAWVQGASADERWVVFRSGPFEVLSDRGEKPAREALMELEQFRHALGGVLGKPDADPIWPIRIVLSQRAKQDIPMRLVRDGYVAASVRFADLGAVLLEASVRRLPPEVEHGLIELFSTLAVDGTHLRLGAPIVKPDRDWARMHLLAVSPEFSGRVRVFVSNYENGADADTAYKNAFEKPAVDLEKRVAAYLTAASFGTTTVSGRALDPNRDFYPKTQDPIAAAVLLADLAGDPAAYAAVLNQRGAANGAHEGLGLARLREGAREDAARELSASVAGGTKSARCYLELAQLESDKAREHADLAKAAELNPRWGEPMFRLGQGEADATRKALLFRKAAMLDPRNAAYWQALAETELGAKNFSEAAKAWSHAERAAVNEQDRARLRAARAAIEEQRVDYDEAERKRIAEEQRRDLERVKNASLAEVRAAEARANAKLADGWPLDKTKVTPWWDGPKPAGKVTGVLERVDCHGGTARLVVQSTDGKQVLVRVRAPSEVVLTGEGEKTLGCGAQPAKPQVVVEYAGKPDKKTGTVGEATTVEFR